MCLAALIIQLIGKVLKSKISFSFTIGDVIINNNINISLI